MDTNGSTTTAPPKLPPPARHSRGMNWLRVQSVNVQRHAQALRPFRKDEFGTAAAAPTDAHLQAANELITKLGQFLARRTKRVDQASSLARRRPTTRNIQRMLVFKE